MPLKFIDKDCNSNMDHGLPFYASGIITDSYLKDGKGNPSGKDYVVEYFDPFGDFNRAWRAIDEIEVSEIDDFDYAYLKEHIYPTSE